MYITDFYSSIFVYEEGATNDYVASSLFNELFVSELDFVETCISVPPFSAIEFSIYDTANCFYFENYYYYLLVYNKNEYWFVRTETTLMFNTVYELSYGNNFIYRVTRFSQDDTSNVSRIQKSDTSVIV